MVEVASGDARLAISAPRKERFIRVVVADPKPDYVRAITYADRPDTSVDPRGIVRVPGVNSLELEAGVRRVSKELPVGGERLHADIRGEGCE
jgi:hypothetical protein